MEDQNKSSQSYGEPPATQPEPSSLFAVFDAQTPSFGNSGELFPSDDVTPTSIPRPIRNGPNVFTAPSDEEVLESGTRNSTPSNCNDTGAGVPEAPNSVSNDKGVQTAEQRPNHPYDPMPVDPLLVEVNNLRSSLGNLVEDVQERDRKHYDNTRKSIEDYDQSATKRTRSLLDGCEKRFGPVEKRLKKTEDKLVKLDGDMVRQREFKKIVEKVNKLYKKKGSK